MYKKGIPYEIIPCKVEASRCERIPLSVEESQRLNKPEFVYLNANRFNQGWVPTADIDCISTEKRLFLLISKRK